MPKAAPVLPAAPRLPQPKMSRGVPLVVNGEQVYRVRVWDPTLRHQREELVAGFPAAVMRQAELEAKPFRAVQQTQRLTFHDAFGLYLKEFETMPDGRPRPFASVMNDKRWYTYYIRPIFGNAYIDTLDLPDLHDHIANLRLKDKLTPAGPATRQNVAGVFKRFFKWARYRRLIPENIALELKTGWGRRPRKQLIPSLPMVEAQAQLFDTIQPGAGDIVRLLAYTAMRWEEAAAVQLPDVNLADQLIAMVRTASESSGRRDHRDDGKSAAAVRTIIIPDQAMMPVRRLYRRGQLEHLKRPQHPSLLVTAVRPTVNNAYYSYATWRRIYVAARALTTEKLYTAHELRHVCASILIATPGISDVQIARQMGHARVETTKNLYAHLFAQSHEDLLAAVNATVSRLWLAGGHHLDVG